MKPPLLASLVLPLVLLAACRSTPDAESPQDRPEVRYYVIADT